MNLLRKPGAIVVAALALAVLPGAASAHDGDHPFANCTEAYAAGYANLPKGNEHYGSHLDRDGDGIGCDQPPADFKAHDDDVTAGDPGQAEPGPRRDRRRRHHGLLRRRGFHRAPHGRRPGGIGTQAPRDTLTTRTGGIGTCTGQAWSYQARAAIRHPRDVRTN